LFVRADIVTTISQYLIARAISMKLTGNIHYPLLMTWLDSGGQRSRSQQTVEVEMASRGLWGVEVHVLVLSLFPG